MGQMYLIIKLAKLNLPKDQFCGASTSRIWKTAVMAKAMNNGMMSASRELRILFELFPLTRYDQNWNGALPHYLFRCGAQGSPSQIRHLLGTNDDDRGVDLLDDL